MPISESTNARMGALFIVCFSAGLFALHLNHALGNRETQQRFLSGICIPMLFTLAVFTGSLGLWLVNWIV